MSYIKKKIKRAKNIHGNIERPRACLYKGNKNLTAQIINDDKGEVLAYVTTVGDKDFKGQQKIAKGALLGKTLAKKAIAKEVKKVVFDRRHYKYHGIIKSFADALRAEGIEF
ncbi:MAG: large subunit ribosomal protein L18 [Candidatus Magnetoglobus multicellularis str. Araruama]|uniref:Large ribosomal subunit protein uL18 n=1 Tax=Candidatus Magnetoglobus multicellularis str. Araruama TaxID=890399 RepID=A0A1V1NTX4_9BACT|nr:MAG: large subunit ribosomal protein L18 [Candidatus Magnetoglobus multicellularis str. Araruama]